MVTAFGSDPDDRIVQHSRRQISPGGDDHVPFSAKILISLWSAFLLFATSLHATSHVYVLTDDGVWLASDTLMYHDDGSELTRSSVCKVVISSGRLLFNAGYFGDFAALKRSESMLPFESPEVTVEKVLDIMRGNHQDLPVGTANRPDVAAEDAGIVEVVGAGDFRSYKAFLATDLTARRIVPVPLREGIPYGFGKGVDEARERASRDPEYAKRIAKSPKAELIRILESEASEPNAMVGPPYTVFLLRPDGSVSDYSDKRICGSTVTLQFYRRGAAGQ
jgi:hypothetical protein